MRRAGSDEQSWPALAAGVLGALWRCRVELVLLALPAIAWRLLARPLGKLGAGAIVAVTVAAVLVSPGTRGALVRWLRLTRGRRRFRRAWVDAGLAPVRLGRLRTVPAGEVAPVRVSSGCSVADLEARREQLAASSGCANCGCGATPGTHRGGR